MKKILFAILLLASCQKEDYMPITKDIIVKIDDCNNGLYVRWYFNGWNYELFSNRYTTTQESTVNGTQVTEVFSAISKTEKNTSRKNKIFVVFGKDNIEPSEIFTYKGLVMSDTVQIYQLGQWVKIDIDRTSFQIRPTRLNKFVIEMRAYVKNILSTDIIVPPTVTPSETLILEDYFDHWTGAAPYNQLPNGWTVDYSLSYSRYFEPMPGGGLKMNKVAHVDPELYLRTYLIKMLSIPIQSGTIRMEIDVKTLYTNSNPVFLSFETNWLESSMFNLSVGVTTKTITITHSIDKFILQIGGIGGGTRYAEINYIKVYKING